MRQVVITLWPAAVALLQAFHAVFYGVGIILLSLTTTV
jgi:hypothetical protein